MFKKHILTGLYTIRDYFINDEYAEKKLVPMSQECPRRLLSMTE